MSITSAPFHGSNQDNAFYLAIASQSQADPGQSTGINLGVNTVNGESISGSISATYPYPHSGASGYGVLYGFPSINNVIIEGWVDILNPRPDAAPYDIAFQIGTGHTDLVPTPEPTSMLLLGLMGSGWVGWRRPKRQ